MTRDDAPEFFEHMARLALTLGADPPTERQLEYFHALADLRLEDVLVGLRRCARECKFFPQPVEIRERSKDTNGYDRQGPPVPPPYRLSVRQIAGQVEAPLTPDDKAKFHAELRRIKAENDARWGRAPEPVLPPKPPAETVEKPDPFKAALRLVEKAHV